MSDRLAVFNEGRIEQVGTPAEVYEHPATEFVAGFVGISNVLERDGRRFTVRPEKIRMLATPTHGGDGEPGAIRDVVYLGVVTRYVVELDGRRARPSSARTSRRRRRRRSRRGAAGAPRVAPEHTYETRIKEEHE